ncbi:PqqD family protein [Streptomyces sp. NPDC006193]|uniref:PqqD family protein n=1 Tax=Streptomyces sp. NPDC006193 TaxID=3155717 RepID=UPI0033AFC4D4
MSGSGEVLELSDTAAFIFRQIDGVRTLEEISTVVASHYDAELEEVQEDVRDLLTELLVNEVVTVVTPPRPDAPDPGLLQSQRARARWTQWALVQDVADMRAAEAAMGDVRLTLVAAEGRGRR